MLSPMLDIPGSTPVWAQCILFSGFSYYKNLYMLFSKIICSIKEHWWFLTLSWFDEVQRMRSEERRVRERVCT